MTDLTLLRPVQRRVKFGVRRCCFRMLCSFLGGCALISDARCHCDPTRTPVLQVVGHTRLERERNNNDESNENEYGYEENNISYLCLYSEREVRVVAVYSEVEVRYLVGSVEYVWFVTSFAASNFKLLFSLIRPVDDRVNEYNG